VVEKGRLEGMGIKRMIVKGEWGKGLDTSRKVIGAGQPAIRVVFFFLNFNILLSYKD
jgi:hypothetical protein